MKTNEQKFAEKLIKPCLVKIENGDSFAVNSVKSKTSICLAEVQSSAYALSSAYNNARLEKKEFTNLSNITYIANSMGSNFENPVCHIDVGIRNISVPTKDMLAHRVKVCASYVENQPSIVIYPENQTATFFDADGSDIVRHECERLITTDDTFEDKGFMLDPSSIRTEVSPHECLKGSCTKIDIIAVNPEVQTAIKALQNDRAVANDAFQKNMKKLHCERATVEQNSYRTNLPIILSNLGIPKAIIEQRVSELCVPLKWFESEEE